MRRKSRSRSLAAPAVSPVVRPRLTRVAAAIDSQAPLTRRDTTTVLELSGEGAGLENRLFRFGPSTAPRGALGETRHPRRRFASTPGCVSTGEQSSATRRPSVVTPSTAPLAL